MVPHWIAERKQWVETVFNRSFPLAEKGTGASGEGSEPEPFFLPLGKWQGKELGLLMDIPLSGREKAFLLRLAREWKEDDRRDSSPTPESRLLEWLLASLERPTPPPEHLPVDWQASRLPLMIACLKTARCQQEMELLREVLVSYLPKETLCLHFNSFTMLCLIPERALAEEMYSGCRDLCEWVSGLYDACQNELPFPFHLLYHLPYRNETELIERVRDLQDTLQASLWQQHIHRPIAPWHLILEQMVNQLSDKQRERYLHLLVRKGSLPLLEQREWVQTLQIFFRSNLNISLAAKELYIHRNTLIYRLDRIAEETGLDPRSFQDALLLQLCLLLMQADRYYRQNSQEQD